jgi:hypothetical protein
VSQCIRESHDGNLAVVAYDAVDFGQMVEKPSACESGERAADRDVRPKTEGTQALGHGCTVNCGHPRGHGDADEGSIRLGDASSGAFERVETSETIEVGPMPGSAQGSRDVSHAELFVSVGRVRDKSDIDGKGHARTSVGMMAAKLLW